MGCTELRQLLMRTDWRESESLSSGIVFHIRTCPLCHHGLVQLLEEIIADDPLSCEQCRLYLPDYYEATRTEYPLVVMTNEKMAHMVLHLSHCIACHEEYEELVLLSELEERNEIVDL
jgi:hypothetical protein